VTAQLHPAAVIYARRWPTSVVALLVGFIALLPERYRFLRGWTLVAVLALVAVLTLASMLPHDRPRTRRVAIAATLALLVLLTALLVAALTAVIWRIYQEGVEVRSAPVLSTTAALWASNVVVFALWYWFVDRGGPDRRVSGNPAPLDLLFPQNASRELFPGGWMPGFIDYLFLAFVTSTAFSPADTLPVTPRAKLLMMAQAVLSLVLVVVLVGRAINALQ
jgi:uncharacterized membrane protein